MPNPLQTGTGGPPDAPQAGAAPMMQQGPAPGVMPPQGVPMAPAGPPQAPAPTHAQVVAALKHFHALVDVLKPLAKDPDLGKIDMKSQIIDGSTELVAQRILTPAQAVMQLGTVPERPFDQKGWVINHLQQAMQGADALLDHYRMSSPGTGDLARDMGDANSYNADDHAQHMSSLQEHYKGLPRG